MVSRYGVVVVVRSFVDYVCFFVRDIGGTVRVSLSVR